MSVEMVAVWCAALCAGATVWLLHRQDEALRRARLMFAAAEIASPAVRQPGAWWRTAARRVRSRLSAGFEAGRGNLERRLGVRMGPEALCLLAGTLLALVARSPVPVVAGALAVPWAGRQLRAHRARLAAEGWHEAVTGLCAAVAGELRAGRPPDAALVEAVERLRGEATVRTDADAVLTPLLAAARFGGEVPVALRRAAATPGAGGFAAAAACWEVAVDGGAGLADGLDRVAAALRAERNRRDELRAQLAGPRATAVLLALLPAFGVALGVLLGADPLRVLFRTPAGLGCLLLGLALEWAGLAWTARIVRTAEGAP